MQVALVLRSGGVYTPKHVQVLADQVQTWLPGVTVFCLSDVDVPGVMTIPLVHGWPGWWSKLELVRPDIGGNLLYFDLDTVIRGPLDDIAAVNRLTLLRDFYRDGVHKSPEGLQSAVMYLPHADRAEIWDAFAQNPARAMTECARGGDQQFLERFWHLRGRSMATWVASTPRRVGNERMRRRRTVAASLRYGRLSNMPVVPCERPSHGSETKAANGTPPACFSSRAAACTSRPTSQWPVW